MTYRPPPVRPSTRIFRVLVPSGRKRQAQAFVLCIAMLCAAASANATPGTVGSKQAEARQVLAQIQQIDNSLGAAVESYNLANVRLDKIESDQRENRRQLKLAQANLTLAQGSLAARLVSAYTSTEDNSTLSVLLGAASLDDLLNRIEAVNSTSRQDASILRQVTSSKATIQHNRDQLRQAHSEQQTIVAQKAAQKQRIQSQLASRRQLLSSIKGQIAHIRAVEAAQQRQLAAAARTRLSGAQAPLADAVGVSASTPEGSTVAPPNVHGGVVGIAMRYLGVPYVWGGSTPRGFDCSGFAMYVFAQIGVSLPHSSYAQFAMGSSVSISQLQPGDLVFFTGASHMGIYIGGGQFIHAPHTGDVVKISSLSGYYSSNFAGARRI
ncbi:MAG: peptidoglycan DL-endopeptidase CwlO [Gaiellaceae bacterium]|nr:peptidoglycan DL-endopeptidase CwlO [Gaiellaceae bacterium]